MAFRPKPDHVSYQTSADIVGFRKKTKCPLLLQSAATLWIVYGMMCLIDAVLGSLLLGLSLGAIIRLAMAALFIGIAIATLTGGARGIWGYAWVSILLGWVQALVTVIHLGRVEEERPPLINYTPALIPLILIGAGVLALMGNSKYLNWRKKRGFTP